MGILSEVDIGDGKIMFLPLKPARRSLKACASACLLLTAAIAGCSDAPQSSTSENAIKVGALAFDSVEGTRARFSPLLEYLSEELDRPFELVPVNNASQFSTVASGDLDFIFTNPLSSVQLQRLHDVEFLATFSRANTGAEFGGQIVVRADSSVQSIEDLVDKDVACVAFLTAAGGCLFQTYHLQQNDIDPFLDFGSFEEIPSQNDIVIAVRDGEIDAGFVRTGQLEKMVSRGLIDSTDAFRVLDPMQDDYPLEHTTQLYPEWPVAALKDADSALVADMKTVLIGIPAGHESLSALKVEQFVEVADYSNMHDLIEDLELVSWDAEE